MEKQEVFCPRCGKIYTKKVVDNEKQNKGKQLNLKCPQCEVLLIDVKKIYN